jgi:arabinosaccharide transport system substrate-binding protein
LEFLYFDPDAAANRFELTRILPPLIPAWEAPIFSEPDDYVAGRPLGEVLIELAPQVPDVQQNQYTSEALEEMNKAAYDVLNNEDYTREQTAERLTQAADKVRARVAKDRFTDG